MAKIQRMWTPDEVATLEVMAQRFPLKTIAKRLGRTTGSVRGKLWLEGISPYLTVDRFSSQRLADQLGISRKTLTYWIEKGLLKAVKVKGKKRPTYRITRKAFSRFYRDNKDNSRLWALKRIPQDVVEWLGEP